MTVKPALAALIAPAALFALCALCVLTGCGPERIPEKYPNGKPKVIRTYNPLSIVTPENLRRQRTFYFNGNMESDGYYRDGQLHGDYEDYWHNGQKKSHGKYKLGKKQGEWEFYYNKFTLSSKGHFKDDLKEGAWTGYWETGELKSQGVFSAGKETGTWKEWTAKGEPLVENSCFEANAQGRFLAYYANKTIKEDYQCRQGIPSGNYLKRGPDGDVIEKGRFDLSGRKDSAWENFHPNGKPASVKRYLAGMENDSSYAWDEAGRIVEKGFFESGTGERLAFDSLGRLVERRHFLKGQPDGECWIYWPSGAKRSLITYKEGKPVEMRKWHPNGKPMAEGVFVNGHRSGEWKDWYDSGVLKEISHFQKGGLHGERLFYDPKGKLVRTMRYEHGFPAEGTIPKGLLSAKAARAAGLVSGDSDTASQGGWTRTDSRIHIRLHNLDSLPLENVFVQWSVDSARFPSLPARGYTEYVAVQKAYRYAFIKAQAGGRTWICQPVDFVGETLMGPGWYTYGISRAGVMEERATGFLRLEMRKDKEGP